MNANVDGMNKPSPTSGSNTPSANDSDQDFDPSAEMLINDFDDEHTLEEEEANDDCSNITNEISDLKKEGEMPIEELLALYGYQQSGNKADKSQESSQRATTNHGDNNENVKESNFAHQEDLTTNASQGPQVNQSSTTSAGTYTTTTTTTRSSKHMEELSSQWSLPPTATPLTNTNLLIDQEGSDMEDDEEDDDEDDEDDDGDEDEEGEGDWRRTIQVGSDYQAVIPDGLNGYGNVPPYENEDKLLWDAYVLNEDIVVNFLRQISSFDTTESSDSLNSPSGTNKSSDPTSAPSSTSSATQPLRETTNLPMTSSIRDDEVALYLLHQCGHNVEEALRRKRMQQNNPFETMSPWSEDECINFEDGIRVYGKDFHQIQKNKVPTRSVGELVQFYYLWKKTERHDMYASKWRVEKKKYSLHPGTTDYMDRFIDEQENLALQAHSMNMSTSNYTRNSSHGSYSMIHYNHNSSGGNFSGGQQSSNATAPTSTKEIVSSDNLDSAASHQSNGSTNVSGLGTAKSNNCSAPTTNTSASTTTSVTQSSSSSSTALSSSSTITTNIATNNLTSSSSSNNGPETLNSNVSGTINESSNSGMSREHVQNNSSNSNPSKTTSAADLFSPLKMRMNIVDR